jgi:hypothetical protein
MSKCSYRELIDRLRTMMVGHLSHHAIPTRVLARLARIDEMRLYRFLRGETKRPSPAFYAALVEVREKRPTFWPAEIMSMLEEARDYHLGLT